MFFRLCLVCAATAHAAGSKPNIVFMALDDVGWSDVGYHGSDFPTPNIDRLATEGVRLEKYYVNQVCSPTRSAFMTGRYPFHTGLQHCITIAPGSHAHIPAEVPTLAETLQAAGYSTAMVGKWHIGYASWDYTPTGRGFESFAGYLQGFVDYYTKQFYRPGVKASYGLDFWRNQSVARDAVGNYSMDFYMEEAARVLDRRNQSKPFFLYFAHQTIHTPIQAPPEAEHANACAHVTVTKDRNTLCQMASALDTAVGDFVEMLKTRDLWENTVLWVTTDNGGMPHFQEGLPASAASNFPLRGGKTTLFEGGVRGVSFVTGGWLPASASGHVVDGLLQHVDIPVTLAALAGALIPNADGLNVWDVVASGAASPRTEVPLNLDPMGCAHFGAEFNGLISGKWKLISGAAGNYDGWWSNGNYTHEPPTASAENTTVDNTSVWLFDLSEDPTERRNVALDNLGVVSTMQERLRQLADPAKGFVPSQANTVSPLALPIFHGGVWAPFLAAVEVV